MFNSKMYKKYYPIKSSFDIANMNVAEHKKLIYWIKSLSEDIRLHNMNSLKKAMRIFQHRNQGWPLPHNIKDLL